ncbi:MAG: hypothetical protein ABR552_11795, partial [Actinomycetota bacterium]
PDAIATALECAIVLVALHPELATRLARATAVLAIATLFAGGDARILAATVALTAAARSTLSQLPTISINVQTWRNHETRSYRVAFGDARAAHPGVRARG